MEEEQARRRKEEEKKSVAEGDNGKPKIEGLDSENEDDKSVGHFDTIAFDPTYDDSFFVNVGDLKMAQGWAGEDFGLTPTKKRRKKKACGKAKDKTVTKKSVKSTKPSKPTVKKKLVKKKSDDKSVSKKKKTESTPKKKRPSSDDVLSGNEKSTSARKVLSKEKKIVIEAQKQYKRNYTVCVNMINELTPQDLPRKPRRSFMKVSVNIPPGRSIGDNITFENPSVPGQKLRAAIPKDADMENLTFIVKIPQPKVKPTEKRDNLLPRELKDALLNYSNSYDDYCTAEQEHDMTLPPSKRKSFKATTERLKMFDDMIYEFPRNLITPIDVSFLRKNVRQEKSNRLRRENRQRMNAAAETKLVVVEMKVPQKGKTFSVVDYNLEDFEEKPLSS